MTRVDINEAISGRRSTREYLDKPVDEETVLRLIDAAIQAPSASNGQPWTFTVVRDQALLNRISDAAKAHMLATMPDGPESDRYRTKVTDASFQVFYHASALVVISGIAQSPWVAADCALAAENLMLAAYSEGLGTCWIGFAQGFLNTSEGKNALGLPATSMPVAPIIVGYPKSKVAPVPRKKPEIRWIG
jgi:nitroreductase